MATNSSAVKALEKAYLKLKSQELTMPVVTEAPGSNTKADNKATAYLLKESKKYGESLVSFYEEERNRAEKFLATIEAIESGKYMPRRGGRRSNAGRKAE